jgi:predicted DNA-binding ArsR family transcriptional regulator
MIKNSFSQFSTLWKIISNIFHSMEKVIHAMENIFHAMETKGRTKCRTLCAASGARVDPDVLHPLYTMIQSSYSPFSTLWKKYCKVFHSMEKVIHAMEKYFHAMETEGRTSCRTLCAASGARVDPDVQIKEILNGNP